MDTPEIGKVYQVEHTRKGVFHLRVDHVDSVWVTGKLVGWEKVTGMSPAVRPGDPMALLRELCRFTLLPQSGD